MGAQDSIAAMTSALIQSDRLLKLDSPLGNNVLVPQRVIGYSRIGRHYEFTIDVVSNSDTIELKALIAQAVTLWIQQTDKSYLPHYGYVHTARRLGSDTHRNLLAWTFPSIRPRASSTRRWSETMK